MAILVEAISVVVRADSIEAKFPGGWEAFRGWIQNQTLCADGELVRIGFMSPQETRQFVEEIQAEGLTYIEGGEAKDLIVADQQRGFVMPCSWAEFGRIPMDRDEKKIVSAARLIDSKVEELVTPDGWRFDGSLSDSFQLAEAGRVPEYFDFLRTENGLDVYRDIRTGKDVFIPSQK